jgi:hypothetical protein
MLMVGRLPVSRQQRFYDTNTETVMTEENTAEVFKITATDDQGNEIVAYVKPEGKSAYVRSMSSEYGVLEVEELRIDELPDDVEVR